MKKPLFVAISDIHFNLNTLEIATEALREARKKAKELDIPLIIAGDLTDTKAILRGEVANRLLEIFSEREFSPKYTKILIGNHDMINEKGNTNSLNFLNLLPSVSIVDKLLKDTHLTTVLIPYQSGLEDDWKRELNRYARGHIVVMHQGFQGAFMGDYVQDKSSISPDEVKEFIVISGHYHKHQTVGSVTYIGSPYTMSFGEANDGPKGFLVVNSDGSFDRVILNLRKHMVVERTIDNLLEPVSQYNQGDLVWVKVTGEESKLRKIDKKDLGEKLFGHSNFKLDLIPNEAARLEVNTVNLTNEEVFDSLIDAESDTIEVKKTLKALWRELV